MNMPLLLERKIKIPDLAVEGRNLKAVLLSLLIVLDL